MSEDEILLTTGEILEQVVEDYDRVVGRVVLATEFIGERTDGITERVSLDSAVAVKVDRVAPQFVGSTEDDGLRVSYPVTPLHGFDALYGLSNLRIPGPRRARHLLAPPSLVPFFRHGSVAATT